MRDPGHLDGLQVRKGPRDIRNASHVRNRFSLFFVSNRHRFGFLFIYFF